MDTPNDPDDTKSYDPTIVTNHYESKGSYTVELVGQQRRLLRLRRSSGVDLSGAIENSLLAFINHSKCFTVQSVSHSMFIQVNIGGSLHVQNLACLHNIAS